MIYKDTIHKIVKQVNPDINIGLSTCNYISRFIIEHFRKVTSHLMKTKYNKV